MASYDEATTWCVCPSWCDSHSYAMHSTGRTHKQTNGRELSQFICAGNTGTLLLHCDETGNACPARAVLEPRGIKLLCPFWLQPTCNQLLSDGVTPTDSRT